MNAPDERAAFATDARQMTDRHADRCADGGYGGRPGSYEHHARVIRQTRASIAVLP